MLFPLDTIFVENTNHWHSWKITILADAQYVCFYLSLFCFVHSPASDSRCAIQQNLLGPNFQVSKIAN